MRTLCLRVFVALALMLPAAAFADNAAHEAQKTLGAPFPAELNLQAASSTITRDVDRFHDLLLIVITAITVFVLALLAWVIVRYRASANPVPSRTTHNTAIEIIWTIFPVLILIAIGIPSIKLLFFEDKARNPEMTVKITGHQWYWGYEYPDFQIDEYPSNYIPDGKLKQGQLRLLSVDQPLVVPVDTEIQFLVTGADVIHSWFVPSMGVNRAAVPGRTNEAWARMTQVGVFYGQCSKICGTNHGYMPIEVRVVPKDEFKQWVDVAKSGGVDKANASVLGLNTADAGDTSVPAMKLASQK